MRFKENLKRLRTNKGITQKELSEQLKISLETLRRYEQGRAQPQSLEVLKKLTIILQCDYNELLK